MALEIALGKIRNVAPPILKVQKLRFVLFLEVSF